MKIEMKDNSRK